MLPMTTAGVGEVTHRSGATDRDRGVSLWRSWRLASRSRGCSGDDLDGARHHALLFCNATDARERRGGLPMKWITREHPRVDRVACPWLIERFVDKQAEFVYVPSDQVAVEAQKRGATPYDIKDVELGHHGPECSFDAFVHKYGLEKDPAMAYMAKVIRGADTADKTITPESQGVEAILDGIRHVHYPNDQKQREASRPLLDALYAFCQKKVEGKAA